MRWWQSKNPIEAINNALLHAYNVVNESIKSIKVDEHTLSFWPLFLTEEPLKYSPSDIDTCATSAGAMCLFELVKERINSENEKDLKSVCKTLLWMRNDDGSWPSIILLSTKEAPKMEGVVNDTIYALDALIKLGFLSGTPTIKIKKDPKTREDLTDLSDRINLILKSIRWLLDNRVKGGWDYTGIEYLESKEGVSPALLPTANVVVVLHTIINRLKEVKQPDIEKELKKLNVAYNTAIEWIRGIRNDSGGFAKKRGEKATIAYTAIAIKALLTDKSNESKKTILKALKWILKNKKAYSPDKIENEEVFDEYRQIIIKNDGTIMWRVIHHENFLEGILLDMLIETENKGYIDELNLLDKYRFRKIVETTTESLLDRQQKSGKLQGAFMSRRGAPAEKYPIYATYFAVLGLKKFIENYQRILSKPSLRTLILWGVGIGLVMVLIPIIFTWAFNLSPIKAIGVFIAELIIGGLGKLLAKI